LPIPNWGRDFTDPADFETARSDEHGVVRWRNRSLLVSGALGNRTI
jgi:hypothetical protein